MAAWVTVAGGLFVEDGIHSRPDEQGEASLVATGASPAASTRRLAARRTGRPCVVLTIAVLPDRCKFII